MDGGCISFWDEIDLADDGVMGDPIVVRQELTAFLKENKA